MQSDNTLLHITTDWLRPEIAHLCRLYNVMQNGMGEEVKSTESAADISGEVRESKIWA